jgi:hypothetical protein
MNKNLLLVIQVIASGFFIFLAYGGQTRPHVPLLLVLTICMFLILASRVLLTKKSFIWASLMIAIHAMFLVILPLNS